jgi:hypothetical protein
VGGGGHFSFYFGVFLDWSPKCKVKPEEEPTHFITGIRAMYWGGAECKSGLSKSQCCLLYWRNSGLVCEVEPSVSPSIVVDSGLYRT